ncbi:DUF4955 domain-containing protein [Vibrio alfacsensis]|uniref:DUF4955 domain-containing protein n=1 Tax=Vibrio alfacsensis TaxID=1074311 RepID=UPI002ADE1AAC|nr:DUF4955 domain-containing protein [Vibrio alfacsensis]WQE77891.1 DUF4955 domain-containing protein [Vibrio alfacsensis]
MKKKLLISAISMLIPSMVSANEPITSKYWENYINTRVVGTDLLDPEKYEVDGFVPPNFSYAGYKTGIIKVPNTDDYSDYKVFDVTEYGAIANDKKSDKISFQKMAHAVSKYVNETGKGAIFYIPEGRFIINNKSDLKNIDVSKKSHIVNEQVISITGSNVIMMGEGTGKTILAMEHHLLPESPKKMWTTPYIIRMGASKASYQTKISTTVVKDIVRDTTFNLVVADASEFKVGDYVEIQGLISNEERIEDAISPYKFELTPKGKPMWGMLAKTLRKLEKHRIVGISDNTLTFDVPVAHNIIAEDQWTVTKIQPAVGNGLKDISFEGSWDGDFVHHANALHDSGYSFVQFTRSVDSWISDVTMDSFNQGIQVSNSFNTTVQNINLTGKPGHIAISFLYGNHNMMKDINDKAHTWHATGLSKYSTHNVILRSTFSPLMGLDLHGAQAMDNLFDNIEGGFVKGHWGAAVKDQPNHLKGLYIWNGKNTGEPNDKLYFMSADGKFGKLIMPHLIGLHGNKLDVQPQFNYMAAATQQGWADYKKFPKRNVKQAYIESNGQEVFPHSLYEAQLELRSSLNK